MKYNVVLTADATVSTTVDVDAESPEEAETKALEEAANNPGAFNWILDEGNAIEPYLSDPGNCAEEIKPD